MSPDRPVRPTPSAVQDRPPPEHRWWQWTPAHLAAVACVAVIVTSVLIAERNGAQEAVRARDTDVTRTIAGDDGPRRTVVYEVEGTARSVNLTLLDRPGRVSTQSSAKVPLVNAKGQRGIRVRLPRGTVAQLSAQSRTRVGTVTCRIKVDGRVVEQVTAPGPFAQVTCLETVR